VRPIGRRFRRIGHRIRSTARFVGTARANARIEVTVVALLHSSAGTTGASLGTNGAVAVAPPAPAESAAIAPAAASSTPAAASSAPTAAAVLSVGLARVDPRVSNILPASSVAARNGDKRECNQRSEAHDT
jgi:hypothetical protein